eukprot:745629-Hanusia_phi.AAC.2
MAEARNGTTDLLDRIGRLPGVQNTFNAVAEMKEEHVMQACRELHEQAHSHGDCGHVHGHGHEGSEQEGEGEGRRGDGAVTWLGQVLGKRGDKEVRCGGWLLED